MFNWYQRWQYNRALKKRIQELVDFVQGELERGVHPSDLLVYSLESPVQWVQSKQVWAVLCDENLTKHELVQLKSGRGGRLEGARVIELLEPAPDGERGGLYSVRFDVEVTGREGLDSL